MTDSDIDHLRKIFISLDVDNSGTLSVQVLTSQPFSDDVPMKQKLLPFIAYVLSSSLGISMIFCAACTDVTHSRCACTSHRSY